MPARAAIAIDAALFGGLVLLAMSNPYSLAPGVFVDSEGAVIACATLFAGPAVGLAASAAAALFRLALGGNTLYTALLPIAATYLASLGLRHGLRSRAITPGTGHLVRLGILAGLCRLGASVAHSGPAFAPGGLDRTAFGAFLAVSLATSSDRSSCAWKAGAAWFAR